MRGILLPLSSVGLVACSGGEQSDTTSVVGGDGNVVAVQRVYEASQLQQGAALYRQHCAECHGLEAQGAYNWRQPGADGRYPAPPLDGSGHTWHHPLQMIKLVIEKGSPGGQGDMPGWDQKLGEREIDAIIAWFQSKWPDEVYSVWYHNDRRAQDSQGS